LALLVAGRAATGAPALELDEAGHAIVRVAELRAHRPACDAVDHPAHARRSGGSGFGHQVEGDEVSGRLAGGDRVVARRAHRQQIVERRAAGRGTPAPA
jgi:hypothetical protein